MLLNRNQHKEGCRLLGECIVAADSPGGMFSTALAHARGWLSRVLPRASDPAGDDAAESDAVKQAEQRAAAAERAMQKAEEANAAQAAFLAHIVHELRTPMTAVIGMTGLLESTELSERQRRMVKTIHSSTGNLIELVNDVLDLSKIGSGKLHLESASFDLRSCIEDCLDLFAAKAAEKGLGLAYEIHDATPCGLKSDMTRVRQVLVNLLGNAIKFTESGEIVVSVTSRPMEGERHEWQFAVRDSGIGIPADRVEAVFDSYTQAETSTTRHYGGTGLGLPISRQLCELMGGSMRVESKVGVGSTFYFTIVAHIDERADKCPRGVQSQLHDKRLVVVDDNAATCRLLAQQARSWGMVTTEVHSGQEFQQLLSEGKRFDAAILSRQLPDTDGIALAGQIRGMAQGTGPRLIQLTNPYARDEQSAIQMGGTPSGLFAAYLPTPIKAHSYYETLCNAVASRATDSREPAAVAGSRPSGEPQLEAEPVELEALGDRMPLRILVADDNDSLRNVAVRALAHMGYEATAVSDGREALEVLEAEAYDLLITDVNMPEVDGLTLAARIREQNPIDPRPYIIASTGGSDTVGLERCLAAGMDDYLQKPWELQTLVGAVERAAEILQEHDEGSGEAAVA